MSFSHLLIPPQHRNLLQQREHAVTEEGNLAERVVIERRDDVAGSSNGKIVTGVVTAQTHLRTIVKISVPATSSISDYRNTETMFTSNQIVDTILVSPCNTLIPLAVLFDFSPIDWYYDAATGVFYPSALYSVPYQGVTQRIPCKPSHKQCYVALWSPYSNPVAFVAPVAITLQNLGDGR